MKYRKKPVIIEATQWFKHGDHPEVVILNGVPPQNGWIKTLEGGHIVTPGDYIITGIKGEHYPCKPDIFEATYEKVSESNSFFNGATFSNSFFNGATFKAFYL